MAEEKIIVKLDRKPAMLAIRELAKSATLVLTASGTDVWASPGSEGVSVTRTFTVRCSYPAGGGGGKEVGV